MIRLRFAAVAALCLGVNTASAEIVITEIMYNPEGTEPGTEWVEIYNRSTSAMDLTGWFLDDESAADFGQLAGALTGGQVGIIHNDSVDSGTFVGEWSLDPNVALFAVSWGSLGNAPSLEDEILGIYDADSNERDLVNYDDSGDWPRDNNGSSIYLVDPELDNGLGTNWALSEAGIDGGRSPLGSTFSTADIGSPGFVPNSTAVPEPGSFAALGLIGLIGAYGRARRNRRGPRP